MLTLPQRILLVKRAGSASGFATATTLDPANKTVNASLSGGNLTFTVTGTNNGAVRATNAHSSGKWYFEVSASGADLGNVNDIGIGAASAAWSVGNSLMGSVDSEGFSYESFSTTGNLIYAGGTSASATAYNTASTIGIAIDMGSQLFYAAKNNSYQASGNPSAGTGGKNYSTTSPMYPAIYLDNGVSGTVSFTFNFGNTAFTYSPPTGFSAWG